MTAVISWVIIENVTSGKKPKAEKSLLQESHESSTSPPPKRLRLDSPAEVGENLYNAANHAIASGLPEVPTAFTTLMPLHSPEALWPNSMSPNVR
jgi:hypothetical protein